MAKMSCSCIKGVGGKFYCVVCENILIKYGFTKGGKQRYNCKLCKSYYIENYSNQAYNKEINNNIVSLTKEGVGIRGTARLLKIAANTVLSRIKKIASKIKQPVIKTNQTFEVDELCTFVKHKENKIWVVAAYCQETKNIVAFNACAEIVEASGKCTNKTLKSVIQTVQNSNPKKIITDKLRNYKYLVNKDLHSTKFRGINHIERMNLTLSTHLKRLNRKTLSFSRSLLFWYQF